MKYWSLKVLMKYEGKKAEYQLGKLHFKWNKFQHIFHCLFQIIGYFGAKKLNIKLLNFYWLLILLLLINDIIFGIIFLYNYNILITNLNFKLKSQLKLYASKQSGVNGESSSAGDEFVELWQKLQVEYKCCGVDNFVDFYNVNVSNMAGKWTCSFMLYYLFIY